MIAHQTGGPSPLDPLRVAPHPLPYRNTNKMWYLWGDNNKHDTMRREGENDTTHIGCGSGLDPMHPFSSSYPASGDKGIVIALDKYVTLSSEIDVN